jgi:hypothetical protein
MLASARGGAAYLTMDPEVAVLVVVVVLLLVRGGPL